MDISLSLTIVGSKAPHALLAGIHCEWTYVLRSSDSKTLSLFFLSANAASMSDLPISNLRISPRERDEATPYPIGLWRRAGSITSLNSSRLPLSSSFLLLFNLTALLIINGFILLLQPIDHLYVPRTRRAVFFANGTFI